MIRAAELTGRDTVSRLESAVEGLCAAEAALVAGGFDGRPLPDQTQCKVEPGFPDVLCYGGVQLTPENLRQGGDAAAYRRGTGFYAIIMDPPSYGRGPSGEVWKLEENLYPFVRLCSQVLSDKPLFVILNSYTTGLAPSVLGYILQMLVGKKYGGRVEWDELGLPCTESGMALPCGATGRWIGE